MVAGYAELTEMKEILVAGACNHLNLLVPIQNETHSTRSIAHLRLLRSGLPPEPGRPCDASVTRPVEMREQGRSSQEISAPCLPSSRDQDSNFRAVSAIKIPICRELQ